MGEKKKAKWTSGPLKTRLLSDIFVPSIWHRCLVPDMEPEWDSEQICGGKEEIALPVPELTL